MPGKQSEFRNKEIQRDTGNFRGDTDVRHVDGGGGFVGACIHQSYHVICLNVCCLFYVSQLFLNLSTCVLSHVQLLVTLWTVACQVPLSIGFFQARTLEWVAISSSRESSQPRDQTYDSCISCIGRLVLYHQCHWGGPYDP